MARSTLLTSLLSCLVVLAANGQEQGQDSGQPERKRVDLSADAFTGVDSAGVAVQRLVGNVRLSQDQTRLRADRASQYPDRDEILFVGNVVVFERGDTLYSRRVLYNRSTKVGRASGSVRLTDGDVVVTAPSAVYNTRSKRTDFEEGVTLVDSSSVLVSDTGTYWSETKQAAFAGNVRLRTEDAVVRADSLDYDREIQVSRARGNVTVHSVESTDASTPADTSSLTTVVADWAFNDRRSGTEWLRGNVLLFQVRFDSSSVDTLLIRSNTLRILKTDTMNTMFSTGDVNIWNMETSATADSVMYVSLTRQGVRRETIHMFESPVMWFESSQIYGDTLRIASTEGEPDSIYVTGRTYLAESDSVLGRVHQVKGRAMTAQFLGSGRRKMIVEPNAEALYFLKEGDAPNGAVRTSADRIVFVFEDDEMRHVRAEGGVEGRYFPEGQTPDGDLEGFRWMAERRPEKRALMSDARLDSSIDGFLASRMPPPRPARKPTPAPPVVAVEKPSQPQPQPQPLAEQVPDEAFDWRAGTIEKRRGGYTLVVASYADRGEAFEEARATARRMVRERLPVDLFRGDVDGVTYYRVGVGRFNTQAGAQRVLRALAGTLPAEAWILAIRNNM